MLIMIIMITTIIGLNVILILIGIHTIINNNDNDTS